MTHKFYAWWSSSVFFFTFRLFEAGFPRSQPISIHLQCCASISGNYNLCVNISIFKEDETSRRVANVWEFLNSFFFVPLFRSTFKFFSRSVFASGIIYFGCFHFLSSFDPIVCCTLYKELREHSRRHTSHRVHMYALCAFGLWYLSSLICAYLAYKKRVTFNLFVC